jgi:ribosome-binding protein aMBF1 (putative translation factor)
MTMRDAKKKRLEARGWKVGTAAEFLGLSNEEAAFVELKIKLAEGLRDRRQRLGVTQAELAKRLKSSQSRVAKMEAGDPSVSFDLLIRALLLIGASSRELGRMIASVHAMPAS